MTQTGVLNVDEYDTAEQEAIFRLPNRIIEAYQPVAFHQVGYPTRVRSKSELWKYIDVMHELVLEQDFHHLMEGGLTVSEFELLRRLTELIYSFSESSFQRKMIARASVLRSLNVFRHIGYLFGDARPKVFEIGPGCGYLGSMLMLENCPYAATDITQAFYLYQNHFWNFISDGKVIELVRDSLSNNKQFIAPEEGAVVHIPWWEFVKLRPPSMPQFDIITVNHTLCEMHPHSLMFLLMIAQALLRGDETPKAIVFEGWGSELIQTRAAVIQVFNRWGFKMVHSDSRITIFVPSGTDKVADNITLSRPIKSERLKNGAAWAVDSLPLPQPMRMKIKRAMMGMARAAHLLKEPLASTHNQDPLSRLVLLRRNSEHSDRIVTIEQVNSFYTDLVGSENYLSPDEYFLKLIRREGP